MYNPGRNKTLIEVYSKSDLEKIQIETGEYRLQPKLICKAWVEILSSTGKEFQENKKDKNEISHRLRLRYFNGVKEKDYIKMFGKEWDIEYISPPNARYMEMVVTWTGRSK